MESNSEASCISDPNFAVICAFLERFASTCGITYPPFLDLQEMLENIDEVPQELVELHIILLRKARRAVFREKWEKALIKFCHTYSTQDGWEIERFGYKNSRLEVKLRVLKTLLEGQFDLNCKFKTSINTLESGELRSKPVGKDKLGRIYWLQIDPTSNIRVYREDLDDESWHLVAKDRDSLVQLLQELSADELSLDVNLLNEDSTNSVDNEKTLLDTGQENGMSENENEIENEDENGIEFDKENESENENENQLTNGEIAVDEKDLLDVQFPTEDRIMENVINEIKQVESQKFAGLTENGKRIASDIEEEREVKKPKLDEEPEVGEAIEEPVVHFQGEGNGVDCDAGNPDKEEEKNEEEGSTNATEQTDPLASGQAKPDLKRADPEAAKPTPKLWSIDTICGTGSVNHSGDTNFPGKAVKGSQKNFSSFSIESVLEKKSDGVSCSSSNSESPIISVSSISVNSVDINPVVNNVNDPNEQVMKLSTVDDIDANSKDSESPVKSANVEENNSAPEERTAISEQPETEEANFSKTEPVPVSWSDEDAGEVPAPLSEGVGEVQTHQTNDPEELDKTSAPDGASIVDLSRKECIETVEEAESDVHSLHEKSAKNGEDDADIGTDINDAETPKMMGSDNNKLENVVRRLSDGIKSEDQQQVPTLEGTETVALKEENRNEAEDEAVEGVQLGDVPSVENDEDEEEHSARANRNGPERGEQEDSFEDVPPEAASLDREEEATKHVVEEPSQEMEECEKEITTGNEEGCATGESQIMSEPDLEEPKMMPAEEPKVDDIPEKIENNETLMEDKEGVIDEDDGIETDMTTEPPLEEDRHEEYSEAAHQEGVKDEPEPATTPAPTENIPSKDSEDRDGDGDACSAETDDATGKPPEEASSENQIEFASEIPEERMEMSDQKDAFEEEMEVDEPLEETPAGAPFEEKHHEEDEEMDENVMPKPGDEAQDEIRGQLEPEIQESDLVDHSITEETKPSEPTESVKRKEESGEEEAEADEDSVASPVERMSIGEGDEEREERTTEPEAVPLVEAAEKEAEDIKLEAALEEPAAEKDAAKEELEDLAISEVGEDAFEEFHGEKPEGLFLEDAVDLSERLFVSGEQSTEDAIAEYAPSRITRSMKSSLDEDRDPLELEPPPKEEGTLTKRKSRDSVGDGEDEVAEGMDENAMGEAPDAQNLSNAEMDEVQNKEDLAGTEVEAGQRRRSSSLTSGADETGAATQKTGGKRSKRRKRRSLDARSRRNVYNKREKVGDRSSDEEKPQEGKEASAAQEEPKKPPKAKAKDGPPRPRSLIPEREIKLLGISNMEELPTIRQSRRIAQLKLKEEAERNRIKKLKEETKEVEPEKKKKKKKASKTGKKKREAEGESNEEVDEEDADDKEKMQQEEKKMKKRKKKDKLVFNELNPWISSTESSTADEDEDEIEEEPHEEEEILFKSDHEFSPESDVEDPDYKPIKRARTAKVDSKDDTGLDSKYDDTACEKCGKKDHPEWILLCDKCDKGWHASCVRPALMVVPEGDWFCPPCEHTSLIEKLQESLVEYDKCQKQRENEELRKKRLAFVGISLDNVLPTKKEKKVKSSGTRAEHDGESDETASGEGSGGEEDTSSPGTPNSGSSSSGESSEPVYQLRERRSNITSYRYNEYDELIKSALQEEIEAVKGVAYVGKGKDITNQVGVAEGEEEAEAEAEGDMGMMAAEQGELAVPEPMENDEEDEGEAEGERPFNPGVPKDILEGKPRIRSRKKDDDEDYEGETEGDEEDEEYNEDEEFEEEEEELVDEVPPVVPKYDKKKKKSRSLNVRGLDFTSDEEEEDNSDSDFKGESSEEESEFSLPSESESSDGIRRKKKGQDGPLRRSTRARTARYDREFINDDSEEDTVRRKKSRNTWATSESSDSDRSWGRRKRRNNRNSYRSAPARKSKGKAKKKKRSKKRVIDSENEDGEKTPKKARPRKIKYGGLDALDEEQVLTRRTRGKKINYQEMNPSDSEEDVSKKRPRVVHDSDEEFVAEKMKSEESEVEEGVENEEVEGKREANGKAISKKTLMMTLKKKTKRKVIPDPDDFSEDDLLEDEELDEFAGELEDLDDEEQKILGEMLDDGDVPVHDLKAALQKLKDRRSAKEVPVSEDPEIPRAFPPIPAHMENPSAMAQRFPKIAKMRATPPNRPELGVQLGVPPAEPMMALMRLDQSVAAPLKTTKEEDPTLPESYPSEQHRPSPQPQPPSTLLMPAEQKTEPKELLMSVQPPPYPTFPPDAPSPFGAPLLAPPGQGGFPVNNRPLMPPFSSFQGIIPPPVRMPPEYPHPNIPTTVLGLESDALKDKRKQGRKPAGKSKRKGDDPMSPHQESSEENSGDARLPTPDANSQDSPPKRRGRGRGKKQLLAEAKAQQELGISTVQAPTQFPAQGLAPEGGSVITRMLNTPQGPQPFPDFPIPGRNRPPFRSPFPNAIRSPLNPPPTSPSRLRGPNPPLYHASHPLDPSPSGGGSITLAQPKPSPPGPGFARPSLLPRYPADPGLRPPFPSQSPPPRSESFPFAPNFFGTFPPPPIPGGADNPAFHGPGFPGHPFDDHQSSPCDGSSSSGGKPTFEEETGGEFGGLASYFASQREDDLDT